MIETKNQAVKALTEIKDKTGWSLRMIASKSAIHYATISRLDSGYTGMPNEKTRQGLFNLQMQVRGME